MDTDTFRQLENSACWAEINPAQCPCKGYGFLITDFDTIHRCALHGKGVPHPEEEEEQYDWDAHRTRLLRQAYAWFFESTPVVDGLEFAKFCRHEITSERPSMQEWVNAAELVYGEFARCSAEEEARAMGYSCPLEMHLDHPSGY